MKKNIILLSILVFSRFQLYSASSNNQDFNGAIYQMSKTIAESLSIVHKKYYQDVDPREPLMKAMKAFANGLDNHSEFMDPKSYKQVIETTQGEFYGIGVVVDNLKEPEQEYLKVIDVISAGPADKAGLKPNDKMVQVNEETIKGLSVEEVVAKIKGKRNTKVQIKVLRPGNSELLDFEITRDIVKEQNALCYYLKDNNIYYLSLNMFTQNAIKQLSQLLIKCQEQRSKGLILDLRNNSGGLLDSVVEIAGLFLDKGSTVVVTKDRNKSVLDRYTTNREPISLQNVPIFILINNYTASAAEILAGCLKAHSESGKQKKNNLPIFLVGTKTFGKGSVQEVIPISNDCALKLTTALYYLPNDFCVQEVGISPDFEMEPRFTPTKEMKWFTKYFGHESSLKNIIKNDDQGKSTEKKEKDDKEKSWQEKKAEQVGSDYLVLNATRLVEMYHLGQRAYPKEFKSRNSSIGFLKKNFVAQDKLSLQEIKI